VDQRALEVDLVLEASEAPESERPALECQELAVQVDWDQGPAEQVQVLGQAWVQVRVEEVRVLVSVQGRVDRAVDQVAAP